MPARPDIAADPPATDAAPLRYRRWLQALAAALIAGTFLLVAIGGTVTSYDAGMAVPGGFTTFGYWSLIAPPDTWLYEWGTAIEHSHRLKGYVVGWLTIGLLVGVMVTQRRRPWVKWFAWGLLLYVIAQGVLGILRVDQNSLIKAAIHGVTGQVFFCLTIVMAAALGHRWINREQAARAASPNARPRVGRVPVVAWVLLVALIIQLGMGAAIRHSFSALSLPDWPTQLGGVLPPTSQQGVDTATAAWATANAPTPERFDPDGDGTYQLWQVWLHFTHRVGAYLIVGFVAYLAVWLHRRYAGNGDVGRPFALFIVLLAAQVSLGVLTVWTGEAPLYATLHQTVGAALLGTAAWLAVRLKLAAATQPATATPAALKAKRAPALPAGMGVGA